MRRAARALAYLARSTPARAGSSTTCAGSTPSCSGCRRGRPRRSIRSTGCCSRCRGRRSSGRGPTGRACASPGPGCSSGSPIGATSTGSGGPARASTRTRGRGPAPSRRSSGSMSTRPRTASSTPTAAPPPPTRTFAPGRVAYALGLQGPVLALNTTCSSSLATIHLGARSLQRGECDLALAGGVALMLIPDDTAYLCAIGALSPTERCHTFDARADGYARGEGCGVVVLKRLSDAVRDGDGVWAVLRGSAINHDGPSSGLTVPNGAAQEQVLRAAFAETGGSPGDVGYLEAHGTGTPLGDPIELRAALAVYGDRGTAPPLQLGAIKANLGHLELAAGVASVIKAALVLTHGTIPPQPAFGTPNPAIDLTGAAIPTAPTPWPAGTRYAAVSAFGLSGTNVHLVLEAGPRPAPIPAPPVDRTAHLVAVSAASVGSLRALGGSLAAVAALGGPVGDLAATVHRRKPLGVRAAVVAATADELARGLRDLTPAYAPPGRPRIGFVFAGQGAHVAGMGLALAAGSPVIAASLDRSAAVLDPLLGRPLRALLADPEALGSTAIAQPALMAVQLALVDGLRSWGIVPDLVAGHSLGELVAAAVAGVWSVEDALRLAVARGQRMVELARPGAMAAIAAAPDVVARILVPGVEIAAYNAPDETVIAGTDDAVELALASVPTNVGVRRLDVSRPFHSACVDPMLDQWTADVAAVPASRPRIPVVSALSGRRDDDGPTSAAHWRDHARAPVRWVEAVRALGSDPGRVDLVVDLGPTPVLTGLIRRIDPGIRVVPTARRDVDPWRTVAEAVGALFVA
ncbi:MAG: type I polyketide synthase, partial [Myxococcota bacterium]